MDYTLLEQLCLTHCVTSDTSLIEALIKEILSNNKIDFVIDGLGSIIIGNPKDAKVLIAAHIDEVGFQVTNINEDGTLCILPVGWVFPNRLDHNLVYIMGQKGAVTGGVFHKSFLKEENIPNFSDLFCSIGATSKQEAIDMGIIPGTLGSFNKTYTETPNHILASSIDNKVSAFLLIKKLLENPEFIKNKLIVFHNDEEMKDHSANSIAFSYPVEYAVILDYCPVHQEFDKEDVLPKVGQGGMVLYRGGYHIIHEDIRRKLDKIDIFKAFISNRTLPGLEPDNFQNNGKTKAVNLCVPAIGYHGQTYMILKSDIEKFSDQIDLVCNALI